MPVKACAQLKRDITFASRNCTRLVQPWLGGTMTKVYLVQESDDRGTCLVERPAEGGLCLQQTLVL